MDMKFNVNTDRLVNDFIRFTAIDSQSLHERAFADTVIPELQKLGCEVEEDDIAESIGGNCGNIFARFPGYPEGSEQAALAPILFSAHMDTVDPGIGKEAHLNEDGTITGNGKTVLGADDVAAVVEILEGLRILQEQKIPHRPLEILFSVSEERYARGSKAFDMSRSKAEEAYCLDLTGPIGTAAVQAPTLIWFKLVVHGRPAHAGFAPECGINAIQVASKAIARLPQGHLDEETTFNIGRVAGGIGSNIVSDRCEVIGEVRSYVHERTLEVMDRMEKIFAEEASEQGAAYELAKDILIHAYSCSEDTEVCRRFRRAAEAIGAVPEDGKFFVSTFGGSDNNNFAAKGLPGIVPACGMYNPHSVHEYTRVEDLQKGAELVAALSIV